MTFMQLQIYLCSCKSICKNDFDLFAKRASKFVSVRVLINSTYIEKNSEICTKWQYQSIKIDNKYSMVWADPSVSFYFFIRMEKSFLSYGVQVATIVRMTVLGTKLSLELLLRTYRNYNDPLFQDSRIEQLFASF